MRFPKIIRHRKKEVTIYGKTASYGFYRIAYHAAGKRHLRNFKTYGEAKDEAERIVRELATGSQTDALTAGQSRDALAALERLAAHFKTTGKASA
jgi:ABC-type molybdenum transport system ATPase subunit/photorepair protein PhrA